MCARWSELLRRALGVCSGGMQTAGFSCTAFQSLQTEQQKGRWAILPHAEGTTEDSADRSQDKVQGMQLPAGIRTLEHGPASSLARYRLCSVPV